jgi:hypothetical protein
MKKTITNYLFLMCILLSVTTRDLYAQSTTVSTTTGTFVSNNGSSQSTFNFENTNSYGVIIKGIEGVVGTSGASIAELWVKTTPISGPPGVIDPSNGWNLVITRTFTGVGNTSTTNNITQPLFTNGDFIVPPGVTYGFCVAAKLTTATTTGTLRYYTQPAGTVAFSGGGCNILTGTNISYGGTNVPPAAPTNTPRGFVGKVTFEPAVSGYNNAGISGLVSPQKFCTPVQPVKVRIKNSGKNQINPVTVSWEVDGIPQSSLLFASLLDTSGGTGPNDTLLTLGNLTFTPGIPKNIRIWTELPNNVADTTTKDDTLFNVLRTGLNGTYTIAPLGADYNSISTAVNDLNKYGICGAVTFNVDANTIYTENPVILTQTGTLTNPIIFQKSGSGNNPLIYGKNGQGVLDAVIALSGVNYVTFDGIDVTDSISNITALTQMEYGYGIVNTSATTGSSNNTIKNCKVILKRSNTSTVGVAQSTLTPATALSGANHNNRYENIRIENSYGGILLLGTAAFPDSNNVITSTGADTTCIGSVSTTGDIGAGTAVVTGINIAEQKNVEVSKCIVRNLSTASTGYSHGIWLNNTTTTSNYGIARIFNNQIYNLVRTTAASAAASSIIAIRIDVGTQGSAQVYNNIIHSITSSNTAHTANSVTVRGIAHGITVLTGSAEFYHNSVHLNNTNTFTAIAAFTKAATAAATIRNNIFSVTSVAQSANPKHYAVYINVTTPNVISSNNILWSSPTANGFVAYAGSTLADRASLSLYAASISGTAPSDGNESGSANVNPNFTSGTDLTFSSATAAAVSGTQINSFVIPSDIAGNIRAVAAPTIGAYETIQPLFDSAAPVISNILVKNGAAPSIYATIKDNNGMLPAGNIQLWYRLGTSGVFTAAVPDSFPVSSIDGTYKWSGSIGSVAAGTYQFYISARDFTAPGSNISTNPIQALTFSGFSATDPVNYLANPDPGVNTRTFNKLSVLSGGTYSVGPTGSYLKLTDAANALSTSDLTGNVIFQLQSTYDGTTGETFPIVFNQFVSTGGNWSATIRPAAGATALQVKGSNAILIDLNGVKRLTIDGRPGGVGTTQQLTLTNTSASGVAVRFINDAQNDTLIYLNIADSNNSVTSGGIVFSTTTGSGGNSNNTIDHCNINGSSASANGIYSVGSSAPAENKNNTITNCNIFDFFSNSVAAVNGILLSAGNASWKIGTTGNGNNFYQTAIRNSTSIPALNTAVGFRAIQISDTSVAGCSIVGNTIGGNIPGIAGSTFVIGDNVGTAYVGSYIRAIDIVNASSGVPTSIQGNTISNMTLYTSITGGFAGIHVLSGLVNTGNLAGNTIGSPTGTGSINVFYKNTTTGVNLYGIRYSGASGGLIQNNTIGSITNDAGAGSDQLLLLYGSGTYFYPLTVSNNTIGSLTTAHSIQSTASSVGHINIMGIVMSAAQGASISITNNTVMNLSSLCTTASTTNGLKGIYITGASTVSTTVSGNTIRKLYSESTNPSVDQSSAIVGISCTASGAGVQTVSNNTISALMSGAITGAIHVAGIYYGSTATGNPGRIERNFIHSLSASPSNGSALISGITQGAGTIKLVITNNMVRLGFDSTGAPATGPHFITGIQKTTGSENVTVFNSVNIGGTGVSNGVAGSFAYRSNGAGTDSLMNNIFVNTRTNASTGANHYAIALSTVATLKINANAYYSTSVLGQFAAADKATITDWRTATSQDLNSVSTPVNFVSGTDLHLTGASLGDANLVGKPLAAYTTDIDNQTRHLLYPYMGADETTPSLPVVLTGFAARKVSENVLLQWTTASENNVSHFEVERSFDVKTFVYVSKTKAAGNSNTVINYQYTDKDIFKTQNLVYYRLKIMDNDGSFEYSQTRTVRNDEKSVTLNSVYPNPFTDQLQLTVDAEQNQSVKVELMSITGKLIATETFVVKQGMNTLLFNTAELQPGMFIVSIQLNGQKQQSKVLKH